MPTKTMLIKTLTHRHTSPSSVEGVVTKTLEGLHNAGLIGTVETQAKFVRSFGVDLDCLRKVEKTLQRRKIPYRKEGLIAS